jgi:hypothetical protein
VGLGPARAAAHQPAPAGARRRGVGQRSTDRGCRRCPRRAAPDLAALERVLHRDGRALNLFGSLLATDSLRGAAGELGLHHSTLQARVAELSTELGYDIRRPDGRTRLSLALSLHLLATNRFE